MRISAVLLPVCLLSLLISTATPLFLATGAAITIGGGGVLGLLALAGIKKLLIGGLLLASRGGSRRGRHRGKRDTHQQLLQLDAYFSAIAEQDFNDCGKKLVCDIKTVTNGELLTDEENLISDLFDSTELIDPSSPKAEFSLAALLGLHTKSKAACTERYSNCPVDSRTIATALRKGVTTKEE